MVGCGGEKWREQIAGDWWMNESADDNHYTSMTTVGLDGNYVCRFTNAISSRVQDGTIEGNFKVKGDVLIDTVAKYSNTNVPVARISHARIIRLNDRELVLVWEGTTSEVVLRKNRK